MPEPRVSTKSRSFVGVASSVVLAVVGVVAGCSSTDTGFTETGAIHCDSELDCKNNQDCVNHGCQDPPMGAGGAGGSSTGGATTGGTPQSPDAGSGGAPAGTCRSNADCLGNQTCISGHCGTLQHAGGNSGGGASGADAGTGGKAGSCAEDLTRCRGDSDCCNYPATARCADYGVGTGPICVVSCATSDECQSRCCTAIDGAFKACAPTSFCSGSCVDVESLCTVNADCCGYPSKAVCLDVGSGPKCTRTCSVNTDCNSNECCLPLAGGGGACGPC